MRKVLLVAVLAVAPLAGCSSSGAPAGGNAQVCADALDAADAGFTQFGNVIQQVKSAIDEGFAGNMAQASRDLHNVTPPDPTRYKRLETQCRAAVR